MGVGVGVDPLGGGGGGCGASGWSCPGVEGEKRADRREKRGDHIMTHYCTVVSIWTRLHPYIYIYV